MDNTDEALLARVQAGDEGAFLLLYERQRRPLFRFAYRMLGSVPTTEDVVHECFLVILTYPMRFDAARGSLRTFLFAIARNLSLKQLQRKGQETLIDEPPDAGPAAPLAAPEPLRRLLEGERCDAVQQAVASLPPLQREVVILVEYEGHSLAEVAAVVGVNTGTVKARLHRARERLRRTLAPWLAGTSETAHAESSAAIDPAVAPRRAVEKMV